MSNHTLQNFLVPTLRVGTLDHRSAVPARRESETTNAPRSGAAACRRRASAREARGSQFESVANPTMECPGSNPNGVKENSLGRLAPGSVEIMVGQSPEGAAEGVKQPRACYAAQSPVGPCAGVAWAEGVHFEMRWNYWVIGCGLCPLPRQPLNLHPGLQLPQALCLRTLRRTHSNRGLSLI